jgi:hypothetical protein
MLPGPRRECGPPRPEISTPQEASLTWIGRPGQYLQEPGSIGGVSRMAALQLGGTLGLLHAAAIELSRLDRLGFELEVTRI